MTRAAAALALVGLAGCRIEREPETPGGGADTLTAAEAQHASPAVSSEGLAARPSGPPVVAPSGLVIPVAGVQPADLADTFDDARSEGRVHDAIDIMAPRGTPVVAAASGTVARLFTSERGGLTVYVLAPDGRTVYYYAHLDAYAPGLVAGQRVRRGDPVGTVGSTGNASPDGPHLHFAVWVAVDSASFWDGEALNPYPLLTGR